jgi:hypothetical protein
VGDAPSLASGIGKLLILKGEYWNVTSPRPGNPIGEIKAFFLGII